MIKSLIPRSVDNDSWRRLYAVFGQERAAQRCGASEAARDAAGIPRKVAVLVVYRGLRRASKSLADALHRLRPFSDSKAPVDNLHGSLSTLLGISRRHALVAGGAALALGGLGWTQIGKAYAQGEVKDGGRLKGVLRFTGEIPAEDSVSISKDSHICGVGEVNPNPLTIGADGALKDGVVALRKVASGKPWPAAMTQPKVDQKRCLFEPFVQVAPKGADLTIVNHDPLLHNIHTYEQIGRARRTLFNIAQPMAGQTDVAPLKMRRGHVVEIDCDAHNWMSAWIYTADHPYVAATGADGLFDIGDVPPGNHELVMWHPILGEVTREITLAAGETLDLSLDMKA